MAKSIRMSITDDITGEENASTHSVIINGKCYEIDLTDDHFNKIFSPLMEHGRLVSRSYSPQQVRAWMKSKGIKVSTRGRISDEMIIEYFNSGAPIDESIEATDLKYFQF